MQSELRTYVPPEVIIPPEEPETESLVEGTLIDTSHDSISDITDSANQNGSTSPSAHFTEIIAERDNLIVHLQTENTNLRYVYRTLFYFKFPMFKMDMSFILMFLNCENILILFNIIKTIIVIKPKLSDF